MIGAFNLILAWTFPSGDFFMFDYIGYCALIDGLLARNRPTVLTPGAFFSLFLFSSPQPSPAGER
jgi:hypothetical protein